LAVSISRGEIVTLFGSGIAPDEGVGATLNSVGLVTTFIGGTRVLWMGNLPP
jgi:hypothetical protein